MVILSDINPNKNPAYSPNLYQWLRYALNGFEREIVQVFTANTGFNNSSELWIGHCYETEHLDDFIGAKLMSVICNGSKAQSGCYPNHASKMQLIDGFWKDYKKIGRCAIDKEHKQFFIGDDSRWTMFGDNERSCEWCKNCTQTLTETKRIVVDKKWTTNVTGI